MMEGLIPYVYRAFVQYKCGHRLYGALVSPGDSGRLAWDSAYTVLPGDSGRFASEALYRRSLSHSPSVANVGAALCSEPKAPPAAGHRKNT